MSGQPITARGAARADLAAITSLWRSAELVDVGESLLVVEDLDSDWNRPGFVPEADVRLFHAGHELVAYGEVFANRAWACVAPAARGRGLGTAMLSWLEHRAREQARESAALRIGQTLADTAHASIALLQRHGYAALYNSWRLRLPPGADLSGASLPMGIRIRALQPGETRDVYDVIERAFNEFVGRSPQSFEAWHAITFGRADYDPSLTFVALDDADRIIGAVYGIQYPDGGCAQQLAVDMKQRRRGIARALLAALFAEFRRRGEQRIDLNTDSRTSALGLYLRLGMEVYRSFTHYARTLEP